MSIAVRITIAKYFENVRNPGIVDHIIYVLTWTPIHTKRTPPSLISSRFVIGNTRRSMHLKSALRLLCG